jgi:hypothetical protein
MCVIRSLLSAVVLLLASCAGKHVSFAPLQPGGGDSTPVWVELLPGMRLKIEGAYYRDGSPRRGLADYLGPETVTYEVRPDGTLRQESVTSFLTSKPEEKQPRDQPAIQTLIRPRDLTGWRHRLFFQIVVNRVGATRPAVLIGSRSTAELDRLTAQFLAGGPQACTTAPTRCTAFPDWCTTSVEIEIVANGVARKVVWGTTLGAVAGRPAHAELLRVSAGRLAPIAIDLTNPEALRLPLVHGDQLSWN